MTFDLLFMAAISWRIDFSSLDKRALCSLNFRKWDSARFVYRNSPIVSCRSKFTPGIETATSLPDSILFTDFFSCWISFICPIFLSLALMNRSWALSVRASIFTPKTAGVGFLKQKSKTFNFAIVGSSFNFFFSISCIFSCLYFSRSSSNL